MAAMVAATLSGCAGAPTIRTADQAIAMGNQLCANLIPAGRAPSKWTATLGDGNSGDIPRGVWRVDVGYDGSHDGVLSLVDVYVFIPKVGKPSSCYALSN
jgi:hypothetical protein